MKKANWEKIARDAEERDCGTAEFLARFAGSDSELRDAFSYLIERRELLRDCEIEQLEHSSDELMAQLADLKRKILVEELACFKDVMALYKTLRRNNGAP